MGDGENWCGRASDGTRRRVTDALTRDHASLSLPTTRADGGIQHAIAGLQGIKRRNREGGQKPRALALARFYLFLSVSRGQAYSKVPRFQRIFALTVSVSYHYRSPRVPVLMAQLDRNPWRQRRLLWHDVSPKLHSQACSAVGHPKDPLGPLAVVHALRGERGEVPKTGVCYRGFGQTRAAVAREHAEGLI